MRKSLLLFFGAALLGFNLQLKAQCYGTVNLDATASANANTFTINTAFPNELILISYDGWPGPVSGPVTVDGNPATFVNSSIVGNSGEAAVYAYPCPTAGTHTILLSETGYSAFNPPNYYLNFAASFYVTGSCMPLGLSNIITTENADGTSSSLNSDVITTTIPNAMIYVDAEYNTGVANPVAISFTGATLLSSQQVGNGIDAGHGSTAAAAPNAYTITSSDPNMCCGGGLILVAIQPPPCGVTVTTSNIINPTCGSNNGSLTANVSGGTAPYTYSWSPSGGTNAIASNLSAGTYTVSVTDNAGCTGTASATLISSGSIAATGVVTANDKCNGNSNGSATITPTGGSAPYTYSWNPGGYTTQTVSTLSAGTYTITIHDNSGCSTTTTVTVTQPNVLGVTMASRTNELCNGGSTGSATANAATGGTNPYTYNWTPSGGTNLTASNLSAGSYTVTATDNNGCTATASVTITQPANGLTITIASHTNVLCNGNSTGSATANAATGGTAPYTYNWTPSGGTNLTASNLSAGTYTITATDNSGCTGTASVTITQAAPIAITIASQTNIQCSGGSGTIVANPASGGTAPYTYSWSPSGGTNLTISNLSAGSYTITATDNNGCTASASATITQPASPLSVNLASINNVLCNGASTGSASANTATGGIAPYTYSWSPSGGTNQTASNLSAGTYTLTVTDHNGCAVTISATITQPTQLAISIASSTNIPCNGGASGSAIANGATGGTSPYTYNWSPSGGTNLAVSNLSAGSYTITATDNNGCTATASTTITQPSGLTISIASQTNILCNSSGGSATANPPSGGTAPYTYLWSPSGGTNLTASNLSAGTYTITATDKNGCSGSASVTITQGASTLSISIASRTTLACAGIGYIVAHAAIGGSPPYTYNWSPSGGTNLSTITTLGAGTYTITATDSNGCTATASEIITLPPTLGIAVSGVSPSGCYGNSNGSVAAAPSGGTRPYTYSWSPSGSTNAFVSGLSAGTYTVTLTDSNGCTAVDAVTLTQPAGMLISSDSISSTSFGGCNGEAAVTVVSGGVAPFTYLWNPGGATTDTIKGQCIGDYCCTVTDANGCSQTICVVITNTSGIDDINGNGSSVDIYPNPSNGLFTVQSLVVSNKWSVEVYNTLGQNVYSQFPIPNSKFLIDLSSQPNGVYLIRILGKDGILVDAKKVVKTN